MVAKRYRNTVVQAMDPATSMKSRDPVCILIRRICVHVHEFVKYEMGDLIKQSIVPIFVQILPRFVDQLFIHALNSNVHHIIITSS